MVDDAGSLNWRSRQLAADVVDDVQDRSPERGKPRMVAVVGKGGVGKTTISAALMMCLAGRGLRVLAVDADPTALLGIYLGVAEQAHRTAGQAVDDVRYAVRGGALARPREAVAAEIRRSLAHTPYGDLLTMGSLGGRGCYCAANSALRATLKGMLLGGDTANSDAAATGTHYDMILVDCEPGLEIFSRGTLDWVDELVVVAEPTAGGLLVAAQIWRTAFDLGLPAAPRPQELRPVLLNKLNFPVRTLLRAEAESEEQTLFHAYVAHLLTQHRLRADWLVPHDPSLARVVGEGQPVTTVTGDGGFMRAIVALATNLTASATFPRDREDVTTSIRGHE